MLTVSLLLLPQAQTRGEAQKHLEPPPLQKTPEGRRLHGTGRTRLASAEDEQLTLAPRVAKNAVITQVKTCLDVKCSPSRSRHVGAVATVVGSRPSRDLNRSWFVQAG